MGVQTLLFSPLSDSNQRGLSLSPSYSKVNETEKYLKSKNDNEAEVPTEL